MEESEPCQVYVLMKKDAIIADNVEGDIYRNRFLASLRDPPDHLTPDYG